MKHVYVLYVSIAAALVLTSSAAMQSCVTSFTPQISHEVAVDADSTCAFISVIGHTSVGSVAGWNQNFLNVTWNCPNQTAILATNANGGGKTTNISAYFTEIIVTCKYHGQRDGDSDRQSGRPF